MIKQNNLPKSPKTSQWISRAEKILNEAGVKSARLDSELILARIFGVDRTSIHAFPNRIIRKQQLFNANNWLNKRAKRIPLSYIFGEKQFYGRNFRVTTNVLSPRPESENLIDLYKKVVQANDVILDVGTGSGILVITAKLETQNIYDTKMYASDISQKALEVAHSNANKFGAEVDFISSDLLTNFPPEILEQVTILISNLPYVNPNWVNERELNELHHEPEIALYADDSGLEIIKKLILQAENLVDLKYLILEADPEQHKEIINFAKKHNFNFVEAKDFGICLSLENRPNS